MAGIGFELKKLFSRRGLFASFRAYGYAGIICTGPMLLGIVLLLGVMFLCDRTGAPKQSRELLVCMITSSPFPVFTDFSVENSPLTVLPALVASPISDSTLLFFNIFQLLLKSFVYLIRNRSFQ